MMAHPNASSYNKHTQNKITFSQSCPNRCIYKTYIPIYSIKKSLNKGLKKEEADETITGFQTPMLFWYCLKSVCCTKYRKLLSTESWHCMSRQIIVFSYSLNV